MIKKLIPIVLSLSLLFCINASAVENDKPADFHASETEENQGRRGNMPPQDMQSAPEMRHAENTPPQDNGVPAQNGENFEIPENNDDNNRNNNEFPPQIPGNQNNTDENNSQNENTPNTFSDFMKSYSTPVTSVILLIFAFVFVIYYKKNQY